MAKAEQRDPDVRFLHGVSYKSYVRLIRHPDNRHTRMAYRNGTLEIVYPIYFVHERDSNRLNWIITTVARGLNLRYDGTGGATFHRSGDGPLRGWGKEPDESYYFASLDRFPRNRELDLDAGDPPPDLWVEVDHRATLKGRLPVYAALGVPEVWQYRVNREKLRFLRLVDGVYQPTERSLSLPILTPTLIRKALALGQGMIESEFVEFIGSWVDGLIAHVTSQPRPE